ncbi:MAG: hypothetical protein ABSE49_34640, partial [Polyangiaceae bacterium]
MSTVIKTGAWLTLLVSLCVGLAFGCGNNGGGSTFAPPGQDASTATDATTPGQDGSISGDAGGSDGPGFGGGDAGKQVLSISPTMPSVSVTITNGIVSTTPVTLQALATNGNGSTPEPASWSFDRGELGVIDATTGIFTASGN